MLLPGVGGNAEAGSRALWPRTGPYRAVPSAHGRTCGVCGPVLRRGCFLGRPWPFCPCPTFPTSPGLCPHCLPTSLSAHRVQAVAGGTEELPSRPGVCGVGGVTHTHSTPPPRDVPDPQRSFLGPTGLSGSQAHQEPGTLGRGMWGSGQCVLRVSLGRGGWAGRRVGGVCWGRGLFWSAPPRFSTPSSSTQRVLCRGAVHLGVNQPETAPLLAVQSPQPRPMRAHPGRERPRAHTPRAHTRWGSSSR